MNIAVAWLVFSLAAVAQTTLNMSEDLVRLGIASLNITPNQAVLDAGPLFFRAVLYAQNHQISRVILDPGAYYFLSLQYSGSHVAWDKLNNLTIDLQGSDLYFSFPLVSGITITNSTNIVLENFTVDYNPLPFTQVRVVSVNPAQQTVQFAVDGSWQNPSALNAVFSAPPSAFQGIEVHFFRNGRPIPGVPRMHAANPVGNSQFTATPDPGFPPSATLAEIRPGDIAFLGMRLGTGPVSVLHCTGCTLRNMVAYSSTYWGFNVAYAQSSVVERLYSVPRPGTDRLAGNYVGLALWSRGPGNQLRYNRFIRTMDTGLESTVNVLGTVMSQTDSRTLVLEGSSTSLLSSGGTPPNGSTVAFQRPSDGTILGSAVILSQIAPPFNGQQPYRVTFTVDRDLPPGIAGTVMYGADDSLRGGDTIIERNALEEETDCCVGFGLYGFSNSVVRGNYVQRSPMSGMLAENALMPGGFNSPPVANLSVTNNVVDSANWTRTAYPLNQLGGIAIDATHAPALLTTSPHQNVSITGNFIADSGSAAVWMGNTTGGMVNDNYFLNPDRNPAVTDAVALFGPTQPLVVQSSRNIATSNNTVDQTSGRMWVTDSQFRELAAYAPGSTIRLNAYELGTILNPAITLTDADGHTGPITVQAATAHSIDVQIPTSAGLGGAYLTLTSGNLKYFGTLFLDSQDNIPALNGCTYELSPAASSVGAGSSILPILVVTQPSCSYQPTVADSFLTAGTGAIGTAVLSIAFDANTGSARTANVEIAGQVIPLSQAAAASSRPVIQAIYDPWNYSPGLAPGAWVTIAGTALTSGPPRTWNLNGLQQLPTMLGSVMVTFNGTPAALSYVSPTQINLLVPATVTPGPVQVIVQSNGVSSSVFAATASATLPFVYALPNADGSTFFITAALAGTATLVGNSAVDPRVIRAAQPGDVLDLYMGGLGGTADPGKFVTGRIFSGAYPLSANVSVTVGGESAPVTAAVLISAGLYQVRLTIPADLPPGPSPIQISAAGAQTRPSLILLLQNGGAISQQ